MVKRDENEEKGAGFEPRHELLFFAQFLKWPYLANGVDWAATSFFGTAQDADAHMSFFDLGKVLKV